MEPVVLDVGLPRPPSPTPAPLTEQILRQIAWEAHDEIIPRRKATDGDCEPVSNTIVEKLQTMGYKDAQVIYGQFQGNARHPHAWVRVGDWEVDATRDRLFADDPWRKDASPENPVYVGDSLYVCTDAQDPSRICNLTCQSPLPHRRVLQKVASATGDIPQNVNFAIRLKDVLSFRADAGVRPRQSGVIRKMANTSLAKSARDMSVQIVCELAPKITSDNKPPM